LGADVRTLDYLGAAAAVVLIACLTSFAIVAFFEALG